MSWMPAFSCSHCGYSVRPMAHFLSVEHCPRCLAKRRVAVPLREDAESVEDPSVVAAEMTEHER